jgi:ADP-heptose:LPS heptosyltransferase
MKTRLRGLLLRLTNPRLLRSASARPSSGSIKRIVVIRPDHLGDLLFATPALARLREAFPVAHITGLVGPWGRAIWQDNPNLDALQAVAFPGIAGDKGRNPLASYSLLRHTARKLAHQKYDLGVTLRFDHWWGAALLAGAGVPRRWGYYTPGMSDWLTDVVPYRPGKHEIEQNLALVDALIKGESAEHNGPLQIDRNRGIPALTPPRATAPDLALLAGWPDAPRRAIIHPGTMSSNKLWTVKGWGEVAKRLVAEGWAVALTGSPDEKALVDAIVAVANEPSILSFVGATANVSQLAWVLGQAHIVLGVDNGPLHIADALDKPTLHLYGPSDETIWGPWGDPQKHRAFRAPGTQPTSRLDTGIPSIEGGPEMRAITVDMVMRRVVDRKS